MIWSSSREQHGWEMLTGHYAHKILTVAGRSLFSWGEGAKRELNIYSTHTVSQKRIDGSDFWDKYVAAKIYPTSEFFTITFNAAERICAHLHIKHLRIKGLICLKTTKVQKVRYDNASFERQQILLFWFSTDTCWCNSHNLPLKLYTRLVAKNSSLPKTSLSPNRKNYSCKLKNSQIVNLNPCKDFVSWEFQLFTREDRLEQLRIQ